MKGAKKHFSRALTLLLSVLIMLQTVTVPAFAAENATENVEVATNDASTEEESTFNLIKADVQIDDEYGNETDYISEVQIPDLEQISEETLAENGVSIHSDYPGDAMVYLTQRWLNQEYGNTIQVYPAGQKDAFDSDNEAILTVGFADISIDNIQESRAETGRTLMVTVKNKGFLFNHDHGRIYNGDAYF